MANTLITPTWVLKEVGRSYENAVALIKQVRQYDNKYEFGGAKVGDVIQYRLPQRFIVADGQAFQAQPILDQTVPIPLTNQKHVDFEWSSAQATTQIEEVQKRYTKPAGLALASVADAFTFTTVYPSVFNAVGTPGTAITNITTYLSGGVKLWDNSAPPSERTAVLDVGAMASIAGASATLFNPAQAIGMNYRNGQFAGNQLGFDEWYQDSNAATHTTGTFTASTPIMASAGQTGSTISITGWASGATTLKRGDVITIANVFGVNRLSYVNTSRLQQFVITADTADAAGATATLPISPSIITSGPLQTVNASPANGAAVTVWSANPAGGTLATTTSRQSLLFHPEAFAFVTADLEMPNGGAKATRVSSTAGGFSFRMVEQWNVQTDQNATRIDMLIGAAAPRPEWAVRAVS